MEIRRFFVTHDDIDGDVVTLTGDEFCHMTKVLRYKAGFKAVILANDGKERLCTVKAIYKDRATLLVDEERTVDKKGASVTLFAGILKNNKLDFAIQKAVELGVDRIAPFVSANCAENKFSLERARKIALEAAKQCGSAYLSRIDDVVSFDDMLSTFGDYDNVIFAYEGERDGKLSQYLYGKNIALVVGPEGGFTREEVDSAAARGAHIVTLGRRILRAETASIVLSALLLDGIGELSYD